MFRAARPQSIIDGIVQAVELFQRRSDIHDERVKKGVSEAEMAAAEREAKKKEGEK